MKNPKSADNLTKKGADANPNGRPKKGYSITEMMREMFNNKPEIKAAIGEQIAAKAMEGDQTAIKTLWQYMDGMPQQNIGLGDMEGNKLEIIIKDEKMLADGD